MITQKQNQEMLKILEEEQPKVIAVKLKGIKDTMWENQWLSIAHDKDEEFDTKFDMNIYFYVPNDINFNTLKVGDILELDEDYEILEIEK